MKEVKLKAYWERYIDNRKIYRVFPKEFEKDIRKNGLNPKNNPYKHKYSDIKKLFKVLKWLEKNHNFGHTQIWGNTKTADQIINTTLHDMKKEYIDFTPYLQEVKYYKKLMKNTGSALVSTVKFITQDILLRKTKLPKGIDYKFIESLNVWAKQRGKYDLSLVHIKGSCKSLQKATYQTKDGENLPSPFGSFKHFKKVIKKRGLKIYKTRLETNQKTMPNNNNFFNLRARSKIPSEEITFLKP